MTPGPGGNKGPAKVGPDRGGTAGLLRLARSVAWALAALLLARTLRPGKLAALPARGLNADENRTDGPGGGERNDAVAGRGDRAPGDRSQSDDEFTPGVGSYVAGLGLAVLLTSASFLVARYGLVWTPAVPTLLVVLAIAQMGVHLVFFLHITTGPDNTNNVLALAFGTLSVILLIGGSLWIMANLNGNMMPMDEVMKMQR